MFLSDVKILTALYRWGWWACYRNQVRGGGGGGGGGAYRSKSHLKFRSKQNLLSRLGHARGPM